MERKELLLCKYQERTMSIEEALELQELLLKDKKEYEASGELIKALFFGGIIIGVGILLVKLLGNPAK